MWWGTITYNPSTPVFGTTVDAVWKSVTEIDLMQQWFLDNIPSFIPEVGFETRFNIESQDRSFLHLWTVT